jgi:hypothetical protein
MPLLGFSNGGNNKKRRRRKRKICKIVAYGAFDETVCTAPLGQKRKICKIVAYGAFDETVCTAPLGPKICNSASADGGPRSRVCARETLRSTPIDISGNFPAHVSAESFFNNF